MQVEKTTLLIVPPVDSDRHEGVLNQHRLGVEAGWKAEAEERGERGEEHPKDIVEIEKFCSRETWWQ